MLTLTRKSGTSVFLTDTNPGAELGEVKVLAAQDGTARLGFEMPSHIHILRDNARRKRRDAPQD